MKLRLPEKKETWSPIWRLTSSKLNNWISAKRLAENTQIRLDSKRAHILDPMKMKGKRTSTTIHLTGNLEISHPRAPINPQPTNNSKSLTTYQCSYKESSQESKVPKLPSRFQKKAVRQSQVKKSQSKTLPSDNALAKGSSLVCS